MGMETPCPAIYDIYILTIHRIYDIYILSIDRVNMPGKLGQVIVLGHLQGQQSILLSTATPPTGVI